MGVVCEKARGVKGCVESWVEGTGGTLVVGHTP